MTTAARAQATQAAHTAEPAAAPERARADGRLNATYWRIELLRVLRNPWMIGFSILMPIALYLLFGAAPDYGDIRLAHGNVAGSIAANMALFGAMMAAANVAGSVADERGVGWNRQLRLTPLRPSAYVATKLLNALILGLLIVAAVFGVAFATGAVLDPARAALCVALAWFGGTALFAAFGLAAGYLFTGEAVLGVVGPLMSLFAFFGGLFIPLATLGSVMQTLARFTPMWGLREMMDDTVAGDPFDLVALANVVLWFAVFAGVAMWRYRTVAGRE